MSLVACPVCEDAQTERKDGRHGDWFEFACHNCGTYRLTGSVAQTIADHLRGERVKRASISHSLRKMQGHHASGIILVNSNLFRELIKRPLPGPFEQADNLVLWLGDNLPAPGAGIPLPEGLGAAVMGSLAPEGFAFVIRHLEQRGLVESESQPHKGALIVRSISLTFDGWAKYHEIKRGAAGSRTAFMAMKFGEPQLDNIVDSVFRPAVEQTGFTLRKLDDEPKAGLIDDRMRVEILTARFLIADLTHRNPGAYWEAGYAEGLDKPVIYTCEKEVFSREKTHFDTNHHLTVIWDPQSPQAAAEDLKATIRATLPAEAKLSDD